MEKCVVKAGRFYETKNGSIVFSIFDKNCTAEDYDLFEMRVIRGGHGNPDFFGATHGSMTHSRYVAKDDGTFHHDRSLTIDEDRVVHGLDIIAEVERDIIGREYSTINDSLVKCVGKTEQGQIRPFFMEDKIISVKWKEGKWR